MKNAVIAALAVALAVSIAVGVIAGASRTMNVEVRVWQDVEQPDSLWLSARPDGGSWADLGTIPVPLDDGLSGTGRYRYGDIVLTLALPPPPSCAEPSLAPDCAILLAARDALAGDGALNWSADAPLTEWDGVTVSGTPRHVTGLDLRARGLTGVIPPELGSLPPTLTTVHLAGNAFTGCVPERLRLAENDLEALITEHLQWCPVAAMPSATILSPGTYQIDGFDDPEGAIVDIPEGGPQIALTRRILGESGISNCFTTLVGENRLCLAEVIGLEVLRWVDPDFTVVNKKAVNALFDQIAATARRAPPLWCWEPSLAPDCAVLLAARDALAGDGSLNWSADAPLTEWDGVTISGTPPRVTGLHLRNRGLTGTIPPELGSLPLAKVNLAGNAFTGCVPERLRLATANDLEELMAERGLDWCPVAAVPDSGMLTPGTTYQMSSDTIIIDVPATGPRIHLLSVVAWHGLQTGGLSFCFSDLKDIEAVCLDGATGEEWSRGSVDARRRNSGASGSPSPPPGLDAVFDQLVATARPAP